MPRSTFRRRLAGKSGRQKCASPDRRRAQSSRKRRAIGLFRRRPQRQARLAVADAADKTLRQCDDRLLFGEPRQPDRLLSCSDDLSGLDESRGDDAVGVRAQSRIIKGVGGEFDAATGAQVAAARFVGGGALAIVSRLRRPALAQQFSAAAFVGLGLFQRGLRRRQLGVRLLLLQAEIEIVDFPQRLARLDPLSGIDQTARDLAADAERLIRFDAGADRGDEAAQCRLQARSGFFR